MATKSAIDDSSVVHDLSPELRADTAFFLIHEHVRTNPMFLTISNAGLAKLVEVLHKNHSSAEEYIVKAGDPGVAMFILIEGSAQYQEGVRWRPAESIEPPGQPFGQLLEGESFGEEIIFGFEETYSYSIVTRTNCNFHSISEDGFQERFQNLPELQDAMRAGFLKSRGSNPAELGCRAKSSMDQHVKVHVDEPVFKRMSSINQAPSRTQVKLHNRIMVPKRSV